MFLLLLLIGLDMQTIYDCHQNLKFSWELFKIDFKSWRSRGLSRLFSHLIKKIKISCWCFLGVSLEKRFQHDKCQSHHQRWKLKSDTCFGFKLWSKCSETLTHTVNRPSTLLNLFRLHPLCLRLKIFTSFCFKCYLAMKHTKHVNKSWTSRKKMAGEGVLFHFKNSSFREKIDWTCGEAFSLPGKQIYCTHSLTVEVDMN